MLVGKRGFEPPTPPPPAVCATRLRHFPFYFLEAIPINNGIIIIKVINTEGLNNQYNNPPEKISIQNSFFCNNCIIVR